MSDDRPHRGPLSRITNAAAGAIDVNALVESVDINELVDRVDIDDVVGRIDIDGLVGRIDIDGLVGRIDINSVVNRIEPDALLDRVDANRLLDRIDANRLLDRVDANRLLDRVEPNRLLDRVDPDQLLDRVDANRLLDRVDPDRLLDRVDANRLLDRVDPNRLLDRVDVDRIMERVDVKGLVDRAGVADIVGDTTGQVAGSLMDVIRRQLAALDEIASRVAVRMTGKDPRTIPAGPALLVSGEAATDSKGRGLISGHYAGPVPRLAAFVIDAWVAFGTYTLAAAAVSFFLTVLLRVEVPDTGMSAAFAVAALALWAFAYVLISLVIAGRTFGMSIAGVRVVSHDGGPLKARQAAIRTLVLPVSVLVFGLGLVGIVFGTRNMGWHDHAAHTAVVFDWGDRKAALPAPLTRWLSKRTDELAPGSDSAAVG